MNTEWLLTGLAILLVLGLLVVVVSSMVIILDGIAKDTPGQQRFLTASLLNCLAQLEC